MTARAATGWRRADTASIPARERIGGEGDRGGECRRAARARHTRVVSRIVPALCRCGPDRTRRARRIQKHCGSICGASRYSRTVEAVRDAMPVLFDLLEGEPEPSVRAVLGHWLFGYIHPYPDGNGRWHAF